MTNRIEKFLGALLIVSATGAMAQDTDEILDFIDSRYESTADMARTIWEYAEVGYQETRRPKAVR
jgi:aminobenzoyl-glutamate utilization protein B